MNTKILSLLLVICATLLFDYSHAWYQQSLRSWVFEPLRPKQPPKRISAECGSWRLEKTYKRGELDMQFYSSRPSLNYVVNIIVVGFDFENRTLEQPGFIDFSIVLRDDKVPNDLATFIVTEREASGHGFNTSISSKEELVVEITYHDKLVNANAKIYIEYEFLNVDDMNKLLREHNL